MAEIALGGMNVGVGTRGSRPTTRECPHTVTVCTITAGLERVVCERCGHLSVRYLAPLSGPIDRQRFARPADSSVESSSPAEILPAWMMSGLTGVDVPEVEGAPTPDPFALEELLEIRPRYQTDPVRGIAVA